jgi:hypothetical protein
METIKMKQAELSLPYSILVTLGKRQLPIFWALSKNIKMIEKLIEARQDLYKVVNEKYCKKTEDGKSVFIVTKTPEGDQQTYDIPEESKKEYDEQIKAISDDEVEVKFHKISADKLSGLSLEANLIAPLIDKVFVEEVVAPK